VDGIPGLELGDFHFGLADFLLVELDLFLQLDHLKVGI
jgi:hypothetical protein